METALATALKKAGLLVENADLCMDRCRTICKDLSLSSKELVDLLDLHLFRQGTKKLSLEELDYFLEDYRRKKKRKQSDVTSVLNHKTLGKRVSARREDETEKAFSAVKQVPGFSTSRGGVQRFRKSGRAGIIPFNLEAVAKPSLFKERKNAGKVELSFHKELKVPVVKEETKKQIEVALLDEWKVKQEKEEQLYMHQELPQIGHLLEKNISELRKLYEARFRSISVSNEPLQGFDYIGLKSQEPVKLVGQISYERKLGRANGTENQSELPTLSVNTVYLQGNMEHDSGNRCQLVFSSLRSSVSLFPGQVVVVEGMCPTGKVVVVDKIIPKSDLLAVPSLETTDTKAGSMSAESSTEESRALSILFASGPFTLSQDLEYEPLEDVFGRVFTEKPDIFLLLGPIIDEQHPLIDAGQPSVQLDGEEVQLSFEDLFQIVAQRINSFAAKVPTTKILVIPSCEDVLQECCFPQNPMNWPEKPANLHCFPNPCVFEARSTTLDIAESRVRIGTTSADIVNHLMQTELFVATSRAGDGAKPKQKLERILHHICAENSFYPLPLSTNGIPLDYTRRSRLAMPASLPDILVIPSKVQQFIRTVDLETALGKQQVLCINPGRVTKGNSAGLFGTCTVVPSEASSSTIAERAKAEVVRV